MLGYTLKNILELIPEVTPLIKSASVEEEYPLSSRSNCLASALAIEYKKNFTRETVDYDVLEKVAQAIDMYDIRDVVNTYRKKMLDSHGSNLLKTASVEMEGDFLTKQAGWEGDFAGGSDIQDMSQRAEILFEMAKAEGKEPSSKVVLYSGNGYIIKQAAVDALRARFEVTKDDRFVKIASSMSNEPDLITEGRTVKSLCSVVTKLDKANDLFIRGFDFYKEAAIEKTSGKLTMVKIAGQEYPLAKVMRIPSSYLDDYVGPGFSKEIQNDPNAASQIIQSLPADSQQILSRLLKNVR